MIGLSNEFFLELKEFAFLRRVPETGPKLGKFLGKSDSYFRFKVAFFIFSLILLFDLID